MMMMGCQVSSSTLYYMCILNNTMQHALHLEPQTAGFDKEGGILDARLEEEPSNHIPAYSVVPKIEIGHISRT